MLHAVKRTAVIAEDVGGQQRRPPPLAEAEAAGGAAAAAAAAGGQAAVSVLLTHEDSSGLRPDPAAERRRECRARGEQQCQMSRAGLSRAKASNGEPSVHAYEPAYGIQHTQQLATCSRGNLSSTALRAARLAGLPREVALPLLRLEALVLDVQLHALRRALALQVVELLD